METTNNTLTTVSPADGNILSVVGDTYRIVISGSQTNGAYAVIDMLVPPGGGPGPHSHADIQEAFYVLDGEIEVRTKGKSYKATAGSFVNIPFGGLVHCFKNTSDKVAHLLCTVTPAGLEDMFVEIGKPVAAGAFLPAPQLSHEEIAQLQKIAEKHGQKLFPPDYLD